MDIWRTDILADSYKLEPLTKSVITKVEENLSIKLPKSYLDILYIQNGGYIIYDAHPSKIETSSGDMTIHLDHIKGLSDKRRLGILETPSLITEWNLPKKIVLFSGDGHSWVAFDYRENTQNPPIIYIDQEENIIIKIANSFDDFLKNLFIEETETETEIELNVVQITKKQVDMAIKNNNIEEITQALFLMPQEIDESNKSWFIKTLFQLSSHPNNHVRKSVAEATLFLVDCLDKDTLIKLIEIFKKDSDSNVEYYASAITNEF